MSKKPKVSRSGSAPKQSVTAHRANTRNWREIGQFTIAFALLAVVVGSGLAAFKHNYDASHDLSVIGKGVPAVVQIHDPNCPLCNQLQRNASSAAERFGKRLLFRIADISTPQGRQLQLAHNVPHVTLLLFDGNGQMRKVLTGVKSDELLYQVFDTHLQRWD